MQRFFSDYLSKWLHATNRKPLVIRGARQVGKTWIVKNLAASTGKQLIELNFEKQPAYMAHFNTNDPKQILLNLSTVTNSKIDPNNALLFLDEIQTKPELFSKLRWFAEDLPELPVIATGSLLDFVLAEHSFSMPVGRINYAHLEPLSFEEFLLAKNKVMLYEYLTSYELKTALPAVIHQELMLLFKEYLVVGGLPAIVASWIKENSLAEIDQMQSDLFATYRDDFAKYKTRLAKEILDEVMLAVPQMIGKKFVYSNINSAYQTTAIKKALQLLGLARICHRIPACSANGLPLAAEKSANYFKEVFLDTGLTSKALGLHLHHFNATDEVALINNGAIAEQVVAQLLRTIEPQYIEPSLYCWRREEANSNAEIDYIIQHGNAIVPIEVKAGATGSLKSLHLFMGLKKLSLAVRINSDYPSKVEVKVKNHLGKNITNKTNAPEGRNIVAQPKKRSDAGLGENIQYQLLSIPFYLTGQLHRLCEQMEQQ